MVETLGTDSIRDVRDRALLLYGFATALRGSELVRLQVADIEAREKGDVVTIGFSKGDQAGEGQTVVVRKYCFHVDFTALLADCRSIS